MPVATGDALDAVALEGVALEAVVEQVPRAEWGRVLASVARLLDECATVPGTKGIMLTFDDFLIGLEQFGQRIQPLMKSRQDKLKAVA